MSVPDDGFVLTGTTDRPQRKVMEGSSIRIEPLSAQQHGEALWAGVGGSENADLWRYFNEGPYGVREQLESTLQAKSISADPFFYAIVDRCSGQALGHAALMRIEPMHRVIEVGNVVYSRALQRTRGATEAMYLLAKYVFEELQYRRYEWKCHSLNTASRRAALRFGFTFEGVFRQHMIMKGQNRDTAWFSMLDSEWPSRKAEFERWLAPFNFDENGRQRSRLMMGGHSSGSGPE